MNVLVAVSLRPFLYDVFSASSFLTRASVLVR